MEFIFLSIFFTVLLYILLRSNIKKKENRLPKHNNEINKNLVETEIAEKEEKELKVSKQVNKTFSEDPEMATTIEEYLKSYVEANKEQILRENRERASIKAEEERIAKEKAEAEAELQRQRDKNLSETGYSETDAERSAREQKEDTKLKKRIELSDYLKRKEGSDCYECKTKVDKDGYCYC